MTTGNTFSTYDNGKQAQIIHDLMDLFRSNQRGYGLGEFDGAKFNEDKNKWIPGHVRWTWGVTEEIQWRDHLSGVRLLGQGVLCDDNKVWYACLDIDVYDIDYLEEMNKIRKSGLPLVVTRTKSGGLRIIVLFNEAIEADLVISRMRRVAASLGYAGCEIFPKQATLIVEKDDCPSWIYVPFGGTNEIFAEQGCMTDNGNLMELADAVTHMKSMRISRSKFMEMFAVEEAAQTNGKANGRKHPKGAWVQEETTELTISTMFHDGPVCLWIIARRRCRDMQNNFLFNVSMFLQRKYPENWDKALEWVNYNVLQPVGDRDKLNGLIKRKPEKEYLCKQEPIHSFCDPFGCCRKPYGVGTGNGMDIDFHEMGMTIIDSKEQLFIISCGSVRMMLEAEELMNLHKFRVKCVAHGIVPPRLMKKEEWDAIVLKNIANATHVKPSPAMQSDSYEIGILRRWLDVRIPTFMRKGEQIIDKARLDVDQARIYFKWQGAGGFGDHCQGQHCHPNDYVKMGRFIQSDCIHHKQEVGNGIRGWWRGTFSIALDRFDEETIERWLEAGKETDSITKEDGNGQGNARTDR